MKNFWNVKKFADNEALNSSLKMALSLKKMPKNRKFYSKEGLFRVCLKISVGWAVFLISRHLGSNRFDVFRPCLGPLPPKNFYFWKFENQTRVTGWEMFPISDTVKFDGLNARSKILIFAILGFSW